MIPNNEHPICEACAGKCCKKMPGIYHPDDLGTDFASVMAEVARLVQNGDAQIDWWEGSDDLYWVRPTVLDYRCNSTHSPSWGGPCALLTDKGCSLPWAKRPHQCRALVPDPHMALCGGVEAKPWYGEAWKPWAKALKNLQVKRIEKWAEKWAD